MRAAVVSGLVAVLVAVAGGCGGGDAQPTSVVLVTHDAFAISPDVKKALERETGLKLRILKAGDAGEVVTRALLTAGNPEGDVLFGVDNNLLTRALDGNVFEAYTPPALDDVDSRYDLDKEHRAVPIDHSEVCVIYDRSWFAAHRLAPPRSFGGLVKDAHLLVVENPATSTPGLAFMLATIAHFGQGNGWTTYWSELAHGGALVTDGWEEAYNARFTQGSGHGSYPIVVSYSSDPAAAVYFSGKKLERSPVGVVRDTCFRQIEFAGVLRGARNEKGARELVDFLLSRRFQAGIPLTMFVLPVREGVPLPAVFRRYAPTIARPLELPAAQIGARRDHWVKEWTDIVVR